jgi:hypothetical protein
MVVTDHALAWLETRIHLRNRPQSDDSARRDGDRVIRQHGVDRRHWQHPAGFYQEIYGFRRHLRESAGKWQRTV